VHGDELRECYAVEVRKVAASVPADGTQFGLMSIVNLEPTLMLMLMLDQVSRKKLVPGKKGRKQSVAT